MLSELFFLLFLLNHILIPHHVPSPAEQNIILFWPRIFFFFFRANGYWHMMIDIINGWKLNKWDENNDEKRERERKRLFHDSSSVFFSCSSSSFVLIRCKYIYDESILEHSHDLIIYYFFKCSCLFISFSLTYHHHHYQHHFHHLSTFHVTELQNLKFILIDLNLSIRHSFFYTITYS